MAEPSDLDLLVRHDLRLRGFADVEELAARRDVEGSEVTAILSAAEAEGLVRHRPGSVGGWTLTEVGRARDERELADELDRSGSRRAVEDAYDRFAACNGELLQLFTDWQLRPVEGPGGEVAAVVNDHSDPGYDARAVARLEAMDGRAQPICADLAGALERFSGYGPRLATARRRVERGELEWFDRLTVDSYHSVWFELHEDLLSTLGRERGAVPA